MSFMIYAAAGILLLPATISDIRRKRINVYWVMLHLMAAFIWRIMIGEFGSIFWNMLPGVFLIAAARMSAGRVGYGDGMIFFALGGYLGIWDTLSLLVLSLVCCSLTGVFLVLTKKCSGQTALPFMPFVAGAFGLMAGMEALG